MRNAAICSSHFACDEDGTRLIELSFLVIIEPNAKHIDARPQKVAVH